MSDKVSYTVTDELKNDILRYLGYSNDCGEDIKKNVDEYIKDGIYKLDDKAGTAVDYDTDRVARSLLKDYCRYANAHALEYFAENFKSELDTLYFNYRVKEHQDSETN